jgi:SulP family sulfate permease
LRLGVVARLLSTPVLAGYLAGSAVVIGSSQLDKIFAIPTPAAQWWSKLGELVAGLPLTNPRALIIGVATVLVVVALIHWAPGVPGILVAVASTTGLVAAVGRQNKMPVIGTVPSGIPIPSLPDVTTGDVLDLLGAGASVALLAFASSMLTASALPAVTVNRSRVAASSSGWPPPRSDPGCCRASPPTRATRAASWSPTPGPAPSCRASSPQRSSPSRSWC